MVAQETNFHSNDGSSHRPSPVHVLLWAPGGAGTHYNGSGTTFYRLYSRANKEQMMVSLAHGSREQQTHEVYQRQYCIRPSSLSFVEQQRFIWAGCRWLAHNAKQFDVLHATNGFQFSVSPAFHAQYLGLPSVVTIAANHVDLGDKVGSWRNVLRIAARRRDRVEQLSGVVATSSAIHEELRSYNIPEANIVRIPYGVDTDAFQPVSNAEREEAREKLNWTNIPTILFVGGVVQRKRPHLIIEALLELKRSGVECQLAIVGPCNEEKYAASIKGRINEVGLQKQVIWQGFVTDVASLYRASDIFVLPSINEGLPNAMLEAMSAGLPTVGTSISGITDLIEDGKTGTLVNPESADVAAALKNYLTDARIYTDHATNCRNMILAKYGHASVLNRYEQLFRRIMAGKTANP